MAVGLMMEEEPEEHVEKVRREGSIVRIKMKDFITYDSVECTPGESLNVVIGPNGTGKSTILSAIVLGLGGKPTLLGKPQSNIAEFIKNDRQEAQIEIELLRDKKRNTTIRRTIFRDGKSLWHLNGRQVRVADIEAETKTLNIQIDNLCQVLPQDRVQDFAKLNKQELLEATQKAVGKEGMSEIHGKLKDLQKKQEQLKIQITSDSKRKELEQGKVDRMKGAVEKLEKRRGLEAEVDAARLKLSIVNYKQKKDEMGQVKNQLKEAEIKTAQLREAVEPFKQQITQAESRLNAVKNKNQGSDRKIRKQLDAVLELRSKLETLREEILELEVNRETQVKSAESQTQKEEEMRQAISKYRNDIAALEGMSPEQIESQLRQMELEVKKLANLTSRAESEKLSIDNEVREGQYQLEALNQKIKRMEDQKQNRMRLLHMKDQDAYQASRWIEANRNLFEAPVYLPMIVELDVQPRFAKYVESQIGWPDLKAITCESKRDMKLIIENCRNKQRLVVNVLALNPNEPAREPRVPLSELKRQHPQFQGYLKDFVRGPSTLINFLCSRKRFHEVPVALAEIECDLPLYYTADLRKSVTQSRYSSGLMYGSDPVRPAQIFQDAANDGDMDDLRRSVDQLKISLDEKRNEQKAKVDEITSSRAQREQIRKEQGRIRQQQTNIQTMRFHLSRKEKDLAEMLRNRKDPDQIRASFKAKIKEAVLKLVQAQEPFYQALKALDSYVVESQMLEFEVQAAKALVSQTKRLCKAEQEALEKAQREEEVIRNNYLAIKTEVTQLLRTIETKNRKKLLDIWNDNQRIFQSLSLPDSPEDLDTLIQEKTAHAEILGGGNDVDVVRQFELLVRQLEALATSISEKEVQVATLDEEMKRRENEWKEELNELVTTISSNFSRYFREMGCAGEVVLYTGNSEHDYDNYGLRIRVKFRDAEELQDLNAHTQSGGERAVSTAIYMLSLQELTPAPFRLVDEINQGMDSINERRVYDILMRSTSRPGTPQYFLLTPKLLKDMEYGAGTTVLCVMNSACAPDHRTWNLKEFVRLRRALGSQGGIAPRPNGRLGSDDED